MLSDDADVRNADLCKASTDADLCDEQLLWSGAGRRSLLGLPQRERGKAREVQLPPT